MMVVNNDYYTVIIIKIKERINRKRKWRKGGEGEWKKKSRSEKHGREIE